MCDKHFNDTDFEESKVLYGLKKRRILKKNVVPSIFAWTSSTQVETPRAKRHSKRKFKESQKKLDFTEKVSNDETCKEGSAEELCQDFGLEIEIQAEKSQEEASNVSDINVVLSEEKKGKETQCGISVQNPSLFGNCRIETLKDKPEVVKYYTGFLNFLHFMLFFQCLGPAAFELNYKVITVKLVEQKLFELQYSYKINFLTK